MPTSLTCPGEADLSSRVTEILLRFVRRRDYVLRFGVRVGKLSGKCKFRLFQGAPVACAGQHPINLLLELGMPGFGVIFFLTQSWLSFIIMTLIAFVPGVLITVPIGGADMTVVVSMLNSYSGWAAAGIGFSLNNPMLIIAGALVGSSGAILSYIMCR
jgi:NAD(P) transhydrogenase subunit beta